MIDEGPHRNLRDKLRHAAGMIHVIMREQNIVDAADPCRLGCGGNAVRIARLMSRPSCINQQRMLRWSHEERCLSAFHIDKKNLKGIAWSGKSVERSSAHPKDECQT